MSGEVQQCITSLQRNEPREVCVAMLLFHRSTKTLERVLGTFLGARLSELFGRFYSLYIRLTLLSFISPGRSHEERLLAGWRSSRFSHEAAQRNSEYWLCDVRTLRWGCSTPWAEAVTYAECVKRPSWIRICHWQHFRKFIKSLLTYNSQNWGIL